MTHLPAIPCRSNGPGPGGLCFFLQHACRLPSAGPFPAGPGPGWGPESRGRDRTGPAARIGRAGFLPGGRTGEIRSMIRRGLRREGGPAGDRELRPDQARKPRGARSEPPARAGSGLRGGPRRPAVVTQPSSFIVLLRKIRPPNRGPAGPPPRPADRPRPRGPGRHSAGRPVDPKARGLKRGGRGRAGLGEGVPASSPGPGPGVWVDP